jgi:hypothetical protein
MGVKVSGVSVVPGVSKVGVVVSYFIFKRFSIDKAR